MFVRSICLILLFSLPFQASAQSFIQEVSSIPFFTQNLQFNNPLSGGFNNPEIQFADIDADGDFDLFYLNSDGTYGFLRNTGSRFNPAFELQSPPPGFAPVNWFFLTDIDADNDADLFTGGSSNIVTLLTNTGTPAEPVFSNPVIVNDNNGNPLFCETGSNPSFADVDGDTDFDFISGNSNGTLNYFENKATPAGYAYTFITSEWQGLYIISAAAENRTQLHGASSLDFADINADGDLDLFWGDFFSRSIYFIENQGTRFSPSLKVVSNYYPLQDTLISSGFNMPRFIDIDADLDYDLFAAVLYDPSVPQSLVFYENGGTPQAPYFSKMTEDYLNTVDLGNDSSPVIKDFNNDGLPDILSGSQKLPNGKLHLFINSGTADNPSFTLTASVFDDLQSDLYISPAAGDIDGDGDTDLLTGNYNGTITLYINEGSPESPQYVFSGLLTDKNGVVIDSSSFPRPHLADVDLDGDNDLIIGLFNGKFSYYINDGSSGFTRNSSAFAPLDIGESAAPFVIDYNQDGLNDLLSGSRAGTLHLYLNSGTNAAPVWNEASPPVPDIIPNAVPFMGDIDSDSDSDLFIGNVKGGFLFYRNMSISSLFEIGLETVNNYLVISAYPNPFNSQVNIILETASAQPVKIAVYNMLGMEVKEIYYGSASAGSEFKWDGTTDNGSSAASGFYFLRAYNDSQNITVKLLLLK